MINHSHYIFRSIKLYKRLLRIAENPPNTFNISLRGSNIENKFYSDLEQYSLNLHSKEFIVNLELKDLSQGYIPYFYQDSNTCRLYNLSRTHLKNYFKENFLEFFKNKLQSLSTHNISNDIDKIKKFLKSIRVFNYDEFLHSHGLSL